MQGKHLGMLFAVYSPQKCQAFLRVICGIVKEGWMNFVSKISLRFDDRTVSSFLHQCGRSREEQSTHLILKAQVVGKQKITLLCCLQRGSRETTAEMAAGAYFLMAQRQFLNANGKSVTESL